MKIVLLQLGEVLHQAQIREGRRGNVFRKCFQTEVRSVPYNCKGKIKVYLRISKLIVGLT